jgi:hypothetical protein
MPRFAPEAQWRSKLRCGGDRSRPVGPEGEPHEEEFGVTIDDIYEAAKARGITSSKRHFSTAHLGAAANYLADAGADGCSVRALVCLYRRLGEEGQIDLQAAALACLLEAESHEGGARRVRR